MHLTVYTRYMTCTSDNHLTVSAAMRPNVFDPLFMSEIVFHFHAPLHELYWLFGVLTM